MPVKNRKRQAVIAAFLISAILVLDQYSKALISSSLTTGQSIPIINNILHLTFIRNTGAAFGLFKNSTTFFIIISMVAVVFIAILILSFIKKGELFHRSLVNLGLILIFPGALGNLIDRLRFGYVIDFIDVRVWPVFNIADTSITIGTILLFTSLVAGNLTHNKSCGIL